MIRNSVETSYFPPELIEHSITMLSGEEMLQVDKVSRALKTATLQGAIQASEEAIHLLKHCLHQTTHRKISELFTEHEAQIPSMHFSDCLKLSDVQTKICRIKQAIMPIFLSLEDHLFTKLKTDFTANTVFGFENVFKFIEEKKKILRSIQERKFELRFSSWTNDREVVMAAVQLDGTELSYASDLLQNDEEIVLAALQQNVLVFPTCNETIQKNRRIVLFVISQDGCMLRFVKESFEDDEEIVRTAIQQNREALQYASPRLQILLT